MLIVPVFFYVIKLFLNELGVGGWVGGAGLAGYRGKVGEKAGEDYILALLSAFFYIQL